MKAKEYHRHRPIWELRRLCQESKDGHRGSYYSDWSERVPRIFSIYVTRLLVRTRLTPNQITWLNIGFAIGSISVLCPMRWWGYVLYAFSLFVVAVVDCCDGEVARCKNQESNSGLFLDISEVTISRSLMFMALGVFHYWRYGNLWVLVAGLCASNAYLLAKTLHYTKFRIVPPKDAAEVMTGMAPRKSSFGGWARFLVEVVALKPPATYLLFLANGLWLALGGRDLIGGILAMFVVLYVLATGSLLFQIGVRHSLDH